MTNAITKNPVQAQCWTGEMGDKWNRHATQFETMLAPIGAPLLEIAGIRPGERVLDVGCGAGGTSLDLAARAGADGSVVGLDISPVLIRTAEHRARAAGLSNLWFVCADATTAELGPASFDCLFSRFGVMFFEDSPAAFANLRDGVRAGGRLVFSCWGLPQDNPWVGTMMEVVARHVAIPPPQPGAPGPFRFGNPDDVRPMLARAGFTDIVFTAWRGEQLIGGAGANPRQAAQFVMDALFVGEALADQPQATRLAVQRDIETLFERYRAADGVRVPAMVWFVTARALESTS